MSSEDYTQRFGGIERLYGKGAGELLRSMHVSVVGIGGVGSWAAESLARSGIGEITLIDYDEICPTNINRQVHALTETIGQKKISVMAERLLAIQPDCKLNLIDDFVNRENIRDYLGPERGYHYVIDAIDSIAFKAMMIHQCRRNKMRIITTGAAGGLTDPSVITVRDLSRTWNDPLAAKVRARLRQHHGFTRNPQRYFRVECVFSIEQQVYPRADGSVGPEKPGIHGVDLDCRFGYGSAGFVTGTMANIAVARVIRRTLDRMRS